MSSRNFTPRIDEDMVAFANTKGGAILLDVRDNRTVIGEQLTNDLKARINSVVRNCTPPIAVSIREAGNVVIVEVPPGEEKPYCCEAGYFRRLDGATQELRVMFREHDPVTLRGSSVTMTSTDISTTPCLKTAVSFSS